MRVYIASPFFNDVQLEKVRFIEDHLKTKGISYFSPRSVGTIKDMSREEQVQASESIYKSNIQNIEGCDILLAVLDDKDTGTAFELGYAACVRAYIKSICYFPSAPRRIITVSFEGKGLNVMLRECVDAHASGTEELYKIIDSLKNSTLLNRTLDLGDIE